MLGRRLVRPFRRRQGMMVLQKHSKAWGPPPGGSTRLTWYLIRVSGHIVCIWPQAIKRGPREWQCGWRGIPGPFVERMPSRMDGCNGHADCWRADHHVRSAPGLRCGKDRFACSRRATRCGLLLSLLKGFTSRSNAEISTLRCWVARCRVSRWLRSAMFQKECVTSTK